ncbi:MAG: hypothetical protein ACYC2R_07130 [Burkholderiales bacterium]|nr:segregation and condensation protein A [Sulfuricellaceae bacterium]
MENEDLSKEQRILRVMRKVLGSIVKDVTPQPGMLHPLSEQTIEDIRACFALISVREAELAGHLGLATAKPNFTDEPQTAKVVSIHSLSKKPVE